MQFCCPFLQPARVVRSDTRMATGLPGTAAMSKKILVNPDHYKLRGRDPMGQDVIHHVEKQQYTEAQVRERRTDTGPKDPGTPRGKGSRSKAAEERLKKTGSAAPKSAAKANGAARTTNTKVTEKRNDPLTAENDLDSQASPDSNGRQGVSSKKGKKSSAQKMEAVRNNFDTMPAQSKVAGAFGKAQAAGKGKPSRSANRV